MNNLLRTLSVVVTFGVATAAIASEPARDVAAAPAAPASAITPATPVAPAAQSATPAAATTAAADKSEPAKVPAGYKVKVVDGETRFCRKSAPLGTRFATETCMTEAQYQEQERNRDSMRNGIQDRQKSYSINY